MSGLGSNCCFVTSAPRLNRGHSYDFASSVGRLMLNLVGLLVYDSSVHIRSTDVVLQVPRDSANPTGKGLISCVDHMVLSYDMIRAEHGASGGHRGCPFFGRAPH